MEVFLSAEGLQLQVSGKKKLKKKYGKPTGISDFSHDRPIEVLLRMYVRRRYVFFLGKVKKGLLCIGIERLSLKGHMEDVPKIYSLWKTYTIP